MTRGYVSNGCVARLNGRLLLDINYLGNPLKTIINIPTKLRMIRFFLLLLPLLLFNACTTAQSPRVVYADRIELDRPARLSALEYEKGTLRIVKEHYQYREFPAGTHAFPTFDGVGTDGKAWPAGSTETRVYTSDVRAEWQMGAGNNSKAAPGEEIRSGLGFHAGYNFYRSGAIKGNKLYLSHGYAEGFVNMVVTDLDDPYRRQELGENKLWAFSGDFIDVEDGVVYQAGDMHFTSHDNGIIAARIEDVGHYERNLKFQGETISTHHTVYPATNVNRIPKNQDRVPYTGLDVRNGGRLMASTRFGADEIDFTDRLSGKTVATFTTDRPSLCHFDGAGGMYWVENWSAVKYALVDEAGNLSQWRTVVEADSVYALQTNRAGTQVAVADRTPTGDVVKFYDTENYRVVRQLGVNESYADDATVKDDKFLFRYPWRSGKARTAVLFAEQDSLVVLLDAGNNRIQIFDGATFELKHSVQWQPKSYFARIDPGDISRVFLSDLEFERDWSKKITANNENRAWALRRNYAYMNYLWPIRDGRGRPFHQFTGLATVGNDSTYYLFRDSKSRRQEFYQITRYGYRRTGTYVDNMGQTAYWDAEGGKLKWSVRKQLKVPGDFEEVLYEQPVTGFDAAANPILGKVREHSRFRGNYSTHPSNTGPRPAVHPEIGDYRVVFKGAKLSTDLKADNRKRKLAMLEGDPHLGIIARGDRELTASWYRSKQQDNYAAFPTDGTFDSRSGVWRAASHALTLDSLIITDYYGEGWHNGQANKRMIWHVSGALLHVFGADAHEAKGKFKIPGQAGNAYYSNVVKLNDSENRAALVHGDEWWHSLAHEWILTNWDDLTVYIKRQ